MTLQKVNMYVVGNELGIVHYQFKMFKFIMKDFF